MNALIRKIMAAALCISLVVLAGCGAKSTPQPLGLSPGTGRYVEESLPLPSEILEVTSMQQLPDGTLCLFGVVENHAYRVWTSQDFGSSWQQKDMPWLSQFGWDEWVISVAFSSPDDFVMTTFGYLESEDKSDQEEGEEAKADGTLSGYYEGESFVRYYRGSAQGLSQIEGYPLKDAEVNNPGQLLIAGNTLFALSHKDVECLDLESNKVVSRVKLQDYAADGAAALYKNTLLISQSKGIVRYDMQTSEEVGVTAYASTTAPSFSRYPPDNAILIATMQPDSDDLFYMDRSGIYRTLLDGDITERLVDGGLTSLTLPSVLPLGFFRGADDRFLVLYRDNNFKLMRFVYDPDIPATPGEELKVYSLTDSNVIRQAIGRYQQQNHNVKVTYKVGMTGEDGVTAADALRQLSNDLLSGQGPDILVLDGIPVDSYIEKGILKDLAPLLDSKIQGGELMPHIANTFRREDTLYAVPATFRVPVIQGGAHSITDLDSFAAWLATQSNHNLGIHSSDLFATLYSCLSYRWFGKDGGVQEGNFVKDLETLGKLADRSRAYQKEEMRQGWSLDTDQTPSTVSLYLKDGQSKAGISVLSSLHDLMVPYAIQDECGPLRLFPQNGVFIPGNILGINAASDKTSLAEQFLTFALGSSQDWSLGASQGLEGEGMRVNRKSLADSGKSPSKDLLYSIGMSVLDEETGEVENIIIDYAWAEDAYIAEFIASLESITTAAPQNAVVREILIAETAPYFAGDKSLQETAEAALGKLRLYLSE